MYDIRQFKPTLYVLLLFGMAGFALAARLPAVLALGGGGVLLNAWLVHSGQFRPLPRRWANVLTLLGMAIVAWQMLGAGSNAVIIIGQFLVVLQLVKLWEQRANRDYAQLLILSLLQMVAAAISTLSFLFGMMLIGYLFLSLYCCLLFHLKTETDTAKAALPVPPEKLPAAVLRQDQRHLSRSMRRLTVVVAVSALSCGIVVFLFFPRTGQNLFAGMQLPSSLRQTGFSDEINLNDVTRLTQNTAVAAHVEVWKDGQKTGGVPPLMLRGLSLDTYRTDGGRGRWVRSYTLGREKEVRPDEITDLLQVTQQPSTPWREKIMLQPNGDHTLFSIAGPTRILSRQNLSLRYSDDGCIQTDEPITHPVEYEVYSSGVSPVGPLMLPKELPRLPAALEKFLVAYAERPEVGGADEAGRSLAAQRRALSEQHRIGPSAMDARIASHIEGYLRGPGFSYTLDTTDLGRKSGEDPYIWFLSDKGRRGHCEYFAGAMALLCQSVGIRARVVVGYRCDEYNDTPGAGYYIVRASHAHAWVEVLTDHGWITYDPTNAREVGSGARHSGWLQKFKHVLDFLEFSYATNVIGYDNSNRDNLIQAVETRMTAPVYQGVNQGLFLPHGKLASSLRELSDSLPVIGAALVVLGVGLAGGWWLVRRWRLRRRAARIGLECLPSAERERLARQLKFYDDLLLLLARHCLTRDVHQTPMEFGRSLLLLPVEARNTVCRLTDIFYRVRFGQAELNPNLQRRLGAVIDRLDASLSTPLPPGA